MWNENHESNKNGLVISKCSSTSPFAPTHTSFPLGLSIAWNCGKSTKLGLRISGFSSQLFLELCVLAKALSLSVSQFPHLLGERFCSSLVPHQWCALVSHPWLTKLRFPMGQGPAVLRVLNSFPGDSAVHPNLRGPSQLCQFGRGVGMFFGLSQVLCARPLPR